MGYPITTQDSLPISWPAYRVGLATYKGSRCKVSDTFYMSSPLPEPRGAIMRLILPCPALGPEIYPERHPGQPAEITIIISPTSFGTVRGVKKSSDSIATNRGLKQWGTCPLQASDYGGAVVR
jgi:hypothetical protein